jgi:transcriptional regulator with XRE-family HTH domain
MPEPARWFVELTRGYGADPKYWLEDAKLDFAQKLGELLEARNMSRAELARRLGTSRAYVTRVLRAEFNLTLESMVKIALALDARVSLDLASKHSREQQPTMELQPRAVTRRPATREVTLAREPIVPYRAKKRKRTSRG